MEGLLKSHRTRVCLNPHRQKSNGISDRASRRRRDRADALAPSAPKLKKRRKTKKSKAASSDL